MLLNMASVLCGLNAFDKIIVAGEMNLEFELKVRCEFDKTV